MFLTAGFYIVIVVVASRVLPLPCNAPSETSESADKTAANHRVRTGCNSFQCGALRVVKVLVVEYPRGEQGRLRLYNAE